MYMEKRVNECWIKNSDQSPSVTIITPVFNRRDVLPRTLDSVYRQTTRDFEYIIVNDGSTQDIDDVVIEFMNKADFPILYLKKENGGVHSARNVGIREARGKMVAFMDSDDEFTDDAIEMLTKIWDSIDDDKEAYLGIRTPVINEKGELQGKPFPNDINTLSLEESYNIFKKINSGVEHYGFRRVDIMKENLWPEPENVTFVTERIVWDILERKYRYYYTNYIPRIYHTEDNDSYIRSKKKSLQVLKNRHWNATYILNRDKIYTNSLKKRFVLNLQVCCFEKIIKRKGQVPPGEKLNHFGDRLLQILLYIPLIPISVFYQTYRLKDDLS